MVQKSLKADVFNIAFWTVYFFCGYLIVGYLIDSNFLKEIPSKKEIYEIFKDSLSITAAFLAPVAAFVLFSDWKEQFFHTKIVNDAQKIYDEIDNCLRTFTKLERLLQKESLEENKFQTVIKYRDEFRNMEYAIKLNILSFKSHDEYKSTTGNSFYQKAEQISNILLNVASGYRELISGFEKGENVYIQTFESKKLQAILNGLIYEKLDLIQEYMQDLATYKSKVKVLMK